LPEWPSDKPLPPFASEAEEARFYDSHSFAEYWSARAKRARRATSPRESVRDAVFRLRLTAAERRLLETRAREHRVSVSEMVRELIAGLAQPPLRIEPGASAVIRGTEGLSSPAGAFAHVRVVNAGESLTRVRCWVRFFRLSRPSISVFTDEMPARWASAPLPFVEAPAFEARQIIDPYKVSLGYMADFAPREEHAACIALKLADGSCFGWTPESYAHGGRHPSWTLPAEPVLVRVHVLAGGRDYFQELRLDASAPVELFRVDANEPAAEGRATPKMSREIEDAKPSLELVAGGKP
jgi:hypothetical protein